MVKPSLFYVAHHDVEDPQVDASAFRQGFRVRTRLDRLLVEQRITPGQWQSAVEYRDAWGTVLRLAGIPLAPVARVSVAGDRHQRALDQLRVVTRIREADDAIGPVASQLCHWCAVDDDTWAASGRRLGCDPETVRDWTVVALAALALAWVGQGAVTRPGMDDRTPPRGTALDGQKTGVSVRVVAIKALPGDPGLTPENDLARNRESWDETAIVAESARFRSAMPEPTEPILQFFDFEHLRPALQATSKPFAVLASFVVENCPRNPERTVALRKLLEAKDAAVRAQLFIG